MENNDILEQIRVQAEETRTEIRRTVKRMERNIFTVILVCAVLLYVLLR